MNTEQIQQLREKFFDEFTKTGNGANKLPKMKENIASKIWEWIEVNCLPIQEKSDAIELNMPTDKQLIDIAILFNDGNIDKRKLADMLAMCEFVLNRLKENNDITKPAKNE